MRMRNRLSITRKLTLPIFFTKKLNERLLEVNNKGLPFVNLIKLMPWPS